MMVVTNVQSTTQRDKKMIEKVLVNGRVVLVSASEKQIERCFEHYAWDDDNEIVIGKASSSELKKWMESLN